MRPSTEEGRSQRPQKMVWSHVDGHVQQSFFLDHSSLPSHSNIVDTFTVVASSMANEEESKEQQKPWYSLYPPRRQRQQQEVSLLISKIRMRRTSSPMAPTWSSLLLSSLMPLLTPTVEKVFVAILMPKPWTQLLPQDGGWCQRSSSARRVRR